MDDGDLRTSPKDGYHHPLITRFHPTSGPRDPHTLRWIFPLDLSLGVYHVVTILRLGQVAGEAWAERASPKSGRQVQACWVWARRARGDHPQDPSRSYKDVRRRTTLTRKILIFHPPPLVKSVRKILQCKQGPSTSSMSASPNCAVIFAHFL